MKPGAFKLLVQLDSTCADTCAYTCADTCAYTCADTRADTRADTCAAPPREDDLGGERQALLACPEFFARVAVQRQLRVGRHQQHVVLHRLLAVLGVAVQVEFESKF